MKFDVVIGNPPYNNDLYLDFVQTGYNLLKDDGVMVQITPAKWQAKGLDMSDSDFANNDAMRKLMREHADKIVHIQRTTDIFDIREVSGICYYSLRKEPVSKCEIKISCPLNSSIASDFEEHDEKQLQLKSRRVLSIIGKVGMLGDGFKQSLYVKNTDHGEKSLASMLNVRRQTFVGEQERGESEPVLGQDYVEVVQGSKVLGYKRVSDLRTTLNLNKYKVTTSIMAGNIELDSQGKTLGIVPCNILYPNQVPKGSYPVLRYFDTLAECESFKSYYESRLVSFLFEFGACGSTVTKEFYRFIPEQPKYDHIFTDDELYKKYNLTQDEINIIESVIKERK